MIRVHDTRTGVDKPLVPHREGHVGIYVCGITPYAEPHIGHARPAVVWDMIRRYLERRGFLVTLVQNFTDVDDKIIDRAQGLGISPEALAAQYSEAYWQALRQLGVKYPDYMPRATGNIAAIIELIERLLVKGLAYQAGSDVYFRVRRFPSYGALSHRDVEDMRSGARMEVNPVKEDPLDFALWKGARPAEPFWESPFGPGRPGWHVECSAMAWRYLGPVVDLHGGGLDLVFPHHENEIAQSESALDVAPHVRYWVHNGLITTQGIKMSKSLDNGTDLRGLIQRFGPLVIRGYLLSLHYRSPLEFSWAGLEEFSRAHARVLRLWHLVEGANPAEDLVPGPEGDYLRQFPDRFFAALDQDFNSAKALAELFEMVRMTNQLMRQGGRIAEQARSMGRQNLLEANGILGIFTPNVASGEDAAVPSTVMELVERRQAARANRDYVLADELRSQVKALGYHIEDTPEGAVVQPLETP